ncbi:hypothetical protein DDE19_19095 [Micromonospora ureilytica]|uniref:DUF6879 domain-containing protein n=1 Tax=Micromonospora ureilytica TaxID=709868 RepID=A0A3N9Y6M8_9ACTN|nr:DUF6879 family protein [Micromonospora ureilytica]RQX15613.1 hypothetical protein DDE19_19095 [Micromonospora ureilytica]
MRDLLESAARQRLSLAEYDADFYATVESTNGPILKTERIQTFREPGSPSWEAYADGRWEDALQIAAEPNPELVAFFEHLDQLGSGLRRLRIVELPLTPYLVWELHFLRHRAEAGEQISVLDAQAVTEFEAAAGPIPELMVVGRQAVYEVLYDSSGTPIGAKKSVEPAVVQGCRSQVLTLLDRAESFESFFRREVFGTSPGVPHL